MWPWLLGIGKWVIRLVGGWLPIGTKPVPEWLGKLLWAVGISVLVFFVMSQVLPKPKNGSPVRQDLHGTGDINNTTNQFQPRFGCVTIKSPEAGITKNK